MRPVEDSNSIRRAYFLEGKSIREISRQLKHGRTLVRKATTHAEPPGYRLPNTGLHRCLDFTKKV